MHRKDLDRFLTVALQSVAAGDPWDEILYGILMPMGCPEYVADRLCALAFAVNER